MPVRPSVSVVVGVGDGSVGSDDLRRSIRVVIRVAGGSRRVGHPGLPARRIVCEARGGQVGIRDSDEPTRVVVGVGDRLSLLIHVRRKRPRRVVSPAFGRAVGVGHAGLLVSDGVRKGVRVAVSVGGGGEQPLLPGRVICVREDVAVRLRRGELSACAVINLMTGIPPLPKLQTSNKP